jgi:hypothetical protein
MFAALAAVVTATFTFSLLLLAGLAAPNAHTPPVDNLDLITDLVGGDQSHVATTKATTATLIAPTSQSETISSSSSSSSSGSNNAASLRRLAQRLLRSMQRRSDELTERLGECYEQLSAQTRLITAAASAAGNNEKLTTNSEWDWKQMAHERLNESGANSTFHKELLLYLLVFLAPFLFLSLYTYIYHPRVRYLKHI